MNFIDERIEQYALNHSKKQSQLLMDLERETNTSVLMPRMISGHLQGRILSFLSKMQQPTTILEIGTYTGFSALCMAEGLAADGKLITIDINEELAPVSNKYFQKSAYAQQIKPMVGNAMEIVPTLTDKFDLVFIDADKDNYLNYFNMIIDQCNSGALIICDNVLWSGKVLEPATEKDLDTKVLQELNAFITADDRVDNVLMPVRDGLMLARVI
jgi:predicted O-methyltransferase YrrM